MKGIGIALLILGIFNFFISLIASPYAPDPELVFSRIGGAFMWGGLGAFLIHRANQKKQEDEDKRKWMEGQDNEQPK